MQLHKKYRATIYLEYRAPSCISVKQAFGCLVELGMLSSYGKDAFMEGWENLRRQTGSFSFPYCNTAGCPEQTAVLTASPLEPSTEQPLGLWSPPSKCPLFTANIDNTRYRNDKAGWTRCPLDLQYFLLHLCFCFQALLPEKKRNMHTFISRFIYFKSWIMTLKI